MFSLNKLTFELVRFGRKIAITGKMAEQVRFQGSTEHELAGLIDIPEGEPRACALFAHCFTCSKEINAAATISQELASAGIATLRFDFTGLGESEGEFAKTSFSSNVEDLLAASEFLLGRYSLPLLLAGHSFGGAACIAAGSRIANARGVVTLGAPFDPAHVEELLGEAAARAREAGQTQVRIAGRSFQLSRHFLDDIATHETEAHLSALKMPLLLLHSPQDEVVGVENAELIFNAAHFPKSLISLDGMDHLVTSRSDRQYIGRLIASWFGRLIDLPIAQAPAA